MEVKKLCIKYQISSLEELSAEIQELIQKAKEQTTLSYAPYSNFHVGAAVLLDSGEIIGGNNQENIAYPSGMCAERVALYYANSQHPNKPIKAIAIAAKSKDNFTTKPISPCGACRQVLMETENRFNKEIRIFLYSDNHIVEFKSAASLLPLNFEL